jgi:transposase-like protein
MRRGRKFWEKVVSVVDGGATQADAAARFGVTRAAVQYWVAKRRREGESSRPELLPVRLGDVAPTRVELEVAGVIVRLLDRVDPEYVAGLVRALRSC